MLVDGPAGETAVRPAPASPARLLDDRCRALVTEELDRLVRRVPSLADDQLDAVETSLRKIINRLLPARRRAGARPEVIGALFGLEDP